MPEMTITHIVLLALLAIVGALAGWFARDRRAAHEQEAVKTMWQEEIDRRHQEQKRLTARNKNLMEQINGQQARQTKLKNSAAELSSAMRDASIRRDELQHEIESRDARIEALTRDLRNWQERLPPLIDRYRKRNREAVELATKLEEATTTVRILEEQRYKEAERAAPIEPLRDTGQFTDGLEASNDEENEYVDEVDDKEMPVFLDESTMIESGAIADDERARAAETEDDQQAEAAEADDDQQAEAAEADDDQQAEAADGQQTQAAEAADDQQAPVAGGDGAGDPAADDAHDPPRQRDNLRKIRGVGPAIEKTLNEMGIISYRQIADMTDYDVDRIARRLRGFHGRIEREDWIGQARSLLDETARA